MPGRTGDVSQHTDRLMKHSIGCWMVMQQGSERGREKVENEKQKS